MEAEDCLLPSELIYDLVVRAVDRHETTNHLAIYVLRRWRRSIPKGAFRPPDGYLEPISSMHVDILYEIFEHLHPIDLHHISQTNRAFQALLSHPNSSSAWNLAFENDPTLPKCPPVTPDFPTKMCWLEWAGMLFGRLVCQDCGEGGAPPNIPFRRFQCNDCMFVNDRLVDELQAIDGHSIAYNLVRKSQLLHLSEEGDLVNTINEWCLYSEAELKAVHGTITGYEDAITREEPGAKEAFDAYKAKRKASVDPINEHAATCLRWAEELTECYVGDLERRQSNIIKRVQSRFKRLGYHPEDVRNATSEIAPHVDSLNRPRLSNKQWEALKTYFEPTVIRVQEERWARERGILINKRKEFVHELYREYKKSVPPLTWAYLPPHYAVYQFKPFEDLINAPHSDELDRASCEEALWCLPKEIRDWTLTKKRQLVSLLPGRGSGGTTTSQHAGPSSERSGPSQEMEDNFEALQLATSVFCCLGSNVSPQRKAGLCLIGWEAAGPHLRCTSLETYWEKRLHFSQRGHDAATALVNLACLDPRTTTAADMDRLDYRYICTSCPIATYTGFKGRHAYNWRDAVLHYIKMPHDGQGTHTSPTWSLLTIEAEYDVKRREEYDPYTTESSWSCVHCPEHFKNMVPRTEAIRHVKVKHNISTPVENDDFFYLITRTDRTPRRQAGFPQDPSAEYRCTYCVSHLHNMKGIRRHLRRWHDIGVPMAKTDYAHVETILRSVPALEPEATSH